jgi:GrpB-like predicted nucleotidyltransferase (UPF0157 family)
MTVELVPHNPKWSDVYATAAGEIRAALKGTAARVEHVGSTAIPGLLAKPVIDVLVLVARYDPQEAYSIPLGTIGFVYDHRDESHVLFKGDREGVRFHLHVVEGTARDATDMLVFRDYLRDHHEEATRYAALKQSLARRYAKASEYADAKTSYVREIVRIAGRQAAKDAPKDRENGNSN